MLRVIKGGNAAPPIPKQPYWALKVCSILILVGMAAVTLAVGLTAVLQQSLRLP